MTTNLQQQGLLLLRQALDNSTADFRPGQWEAMEELLKVRSQLLVVQRTGWGKSLNQQLNFPFYDGVTRG